MLAGALAMLACSTPPPRPAPLPASPDEAYAFRDPREGLTGSSLQKRELRVLEEALASFRMRDLAATEKALRRAGAGTGTSVPAHDLLLAYVLLSSERAGDARGVLDRLLGSAPGWVAALETRGDLNYAEESWREAYDDYARALRARPGDRRLPARVSAARARLFETRRQEADAALRARDLDAARRAALALIELDPASGAGLRVLARVAEAQGKLEDAYATALRARAMNPTDAAWTAMVAELAMKARRPAEALELYSELARTDPSFRDDAEEARFEFELQNLPETAQKAARSARVTRAQMAVLLHTAVPEVRDAPAGPAEVAVDALDRPERMALVRCIALGFFSVSRDTHRVGADQPVTRGEAALLLRHVATLIGGSRLPDCLAEDPASPAKLAECGILAESTSRNLTGREALRAIQRTTRSVREGRRR